jgi:putative peptidoglycan lipid II flippase
VLEAYGLGLIPMVLIRSAVAAFQSRGDTKTPMLCFFAGLAVNLTLKIGLYRAYGAVGLATATAVGAWINFALLIVLGLRRDWMRPDARLIENVSITAFCTGAAAIVAPHLFHAVDRFVRPLHFMRNELDIVLTGGIALVVYLLVYAAASLIFGRSLRRQLL